MTSDGNVKDEDEVSVLVNDDVGTLMANSGWDFYRRRDERVGDVMGSTATTLVVLLCQLRLPNCFAVVF